MALINTLGHDLRSPLTAVRGAATLLIQGLDDIPHDKVLDLLGIIDRRVIQMSDRIEDIIAVAHLDAGDLHVYMESVEVAHILSRVADPERQFEPSLVVGEAPAGVTIEADVERSVQVLRALIANAVRFSQPGAPVELTAVVNADAVRFEVCDHGPGLPAGELEQVFVRLWHGPDGGPGLGLYMARGLARAMNGDVTVSARPDGGSIFSFSLSRNG